MPDIALQLREHSCCRGLAVGSLTVRFSIVSGVLMQRQTNRGTQDVHKRERRRHEGLVRALAMHWQLLNCCKRLTASVIHDQDYHCMPHMQTEITPVMQQDQ